jgi:predicted ester cyclase
MIAEGDKVVQRWTFRGTHQGEFMGIPATGVQVILSAIEIFRLADGKIAEQWVEADNLGSLQQLGVIPALGEGEG